MTEAFIVQSAYEKLLQLPYGSFSRVRMELVLAKLRDELAELSGCTAEEIQKVCEALARH